MKILKSIAIGLAAIAALGGFTACQDDFDNLNVLAKVPEAELTPNTSILEFKQAFWQDGVENCKITAPAADVAVRAGELPRLGTLTVEVTA